MNRPKLLVALNYFRSLRLKDAEETLNKYESIRNSHGEFLSGRFIIEVYLEVQKNLDKEVNHG